ncbi:MAG: hypothetical protein NZL83_04845 [Candidatus Absconditabacterales bacterium]|nr:hypothetical protein [Candidatus Absconditabacterales bacterium]
MYSPMSREQSSSFPPEYYEQRAALLASVTGKTKEALRTYIEKKEGEQGPGKAGWASIIACAKAALALGFGSE